MPTLMSTQRIRGITIDAAGTLITVTRPVGETYAEVARRFGADIDPAALAAGFRECFHDMPPLAFPGAPPSQMRRLERGWWHDLVHRVVSRAGGVADFERYFDTLYEHYARGGAWRAYPEVTAVLTRLRAAGVRLAVVSNFDSRLENILTSLELDGYFDAIVYSTLAGSAKPDRGIFDRALAEIGVAASEALHIGDSRRADIAGAAAAGLESVLLVRGDTTPEPPAVADLGALLVRLGIDTSAN